jgi:hypothetical protein
MISFEASSTMTAPFLSIPQISMHSKVKDDVNKEVTEETEKISMISD